MKRACVRLTARCTNNCIFCAQAGAELRDEPLDATLRARRDAGCDEVTFVGGEPTLAANLPDAIRTARGLGFTAVGVQSNGAHLELDALARAGLTDVHLSVHAATAPAHDYHTGTPGSFATIERALGGESAVTRVVTTVVTRSNFRSLAALPGWLAAQKVKAWVLVFPSVAGRAATGFDRVIPRLGLAVPYMLHATAQATDHGLPTAVAGVPLCTMGPHASRALPPSATRAFDAVACNDCSARPRCCGVDPAYMDRFTAHELRAVPTPAPDEALPSALARMFVGTGPRTPAPVAPHPAPATARHRLPVLGRPQAGAAEVRGRAQQDAKPLFPALFDEEDS